MRALLFILPVVLAGCESASTDPSASIPPQLSQAGPPTVLNDSYWYTNPIQWFDLCPPYQWVEGTVRSHIRSQVVLSEGTQRSAWHLNVAEGKLTDADGSEYVFVNNAEQRDDYILQPFALEGNATISFRLISRGRNPNLLLDLSIHYSWDTSGVPVITSTELRNCRGSGS